MHWKIFLRIIIWIFSSPSSFIIRTYIFLKDPLFVTDFCVMVIWSHYVKIRTRYIRIGLLNSGVVSDTVATIIGPYCSFSPLPLLITHTPLLLIYHQAAWNSVWKWSRQSTGHPGKNVLAVSTQKSVWKSGQKFIWKFVWKCVKEPIPESVCHLDKNGALQSSHPQHFHRNSRKLS